MTSTEIKRPNYYEGQYLGAQDLAAAQEYQRQQDQRHRLAAHTWGIAVGLELEERPKPGGGAAVDVYLKPGYAVDGFGRTIVVLEAYKIPEALFAQFAPDPSIPKQLISVWLRFREEKTNPPRPGFAVCDVEEQWYRIRETFRIVVGAQSLTQQRDKVFVAGKLVEAATEVSDASVPYQALPEAGADPRWLVPLGKVSWSGSQFVRSDNPETSKDGQQFVGVIAENMLAPAKLLRLRPRTAFVDADTAEFASVEGRLRVDGRVVAKKDLFLHGGALSFQNASGQDAAAPLWLQRRAASGGGTDLRVHIGEPGSAATRLTIGPGLADGSSEQVVLAVKGDDTVDLPTGALNFGRQTRQMINLRTTAAGQHQYGLGVQSNTTYFRSRNQFCWFKDGVHDDGQSQPGAGGTLQLRLDDQARLHLGAQTRQMLNLWQTQYGIGVQDFTLYFRSDDDVCWFRGGSHSDTRSEPGGGVLAMKLDDSSHLTVNGDVTVGRDLFLGAMKIPLVDVMTGEIFPIHLGPGNGSIQLTLTSRLPNVATPQIMVALSEIGNQGFAVGARWQVRPATTIRLSANSFQFHIHWEIDGSFIKGISCVAIFIP